ERSIRRYLNFLRFFYSAPFELFFGLFSSSYASHSPYAPHKNRKISSKRTFIRRLNKIQTSPKIKSARNSISLLALESNYICTFAHYLSKKNGRK
ncbi:hypothetical protein, partial [uncultured Bacteroides sp.]|uniref:hypothetical protein n=1 Tax=uncultured Bacteroides sp. TaxID=162156 RepID=UPI00262D350D